MKVVILAGGRGVRIGEETQFRPKPMIEIGGKPILWHIMENYYQYGFREFVICCGYKGDMIKDYFLKYNRRYSDLTVYFETGDVEYEYRQERPWQVTMVNTGLDTLTAGRLLRVRNYLGDAPFLLTYGDGVANLDIDKLLEFHQAAGGSLTISMTKPEGRFGTIRLEPETHRVLGFQEKERDAENFVNIGFMVCEPQIFDYLGDGTEMLERGPFERMVEAGQMTAYEHTGFWSPMDSMKDKKYLEELWNRGNAPWTADRKK